MIFFVLSFVSGVLTVLAPCTLALLPVIVGSSVSGEANKRKALTVAASLCVSVIVFTLLLKVSTAFINIPQNVWTIISGSIIIAFGLISLFPNFWENIPFVSRLSISSNKFLGSGYNRKNFLGDVIIGASLGPVFSSCSPTYFIVLATVLPQSFGLGLLDLVAYSVGLSLSLLVIAFLGQKIISKIGAFSDTRGLFRRLLGLVFILVGLMIITGIDKKIEARILNSGYFDITRFENSLLLLVSKPKPVFIDDTGLENYSSTTRKTIQKTHGPKAPEILNPSGFINTNDLPITIKQYKGKKVVLLDVWTYSCINCQRTLPYVKAWYEKYKDKGLVVIGLHTPEFSFEKVKSNVEDAVKRFGISYPVVLDNNYSTWNAYGNQYWPRKYLISGEGEIVYDHIGEGNYEETEKAIQKALSELNDTDYVDGVTQPKDVTNFEPSKVKSPETYFGSNRNEYLGNGIVGRAGKQVLQIPENIDLNILYLGGEWNFYPEYVTSLGEGKIKFRYNSKNVYLVGSSDAGTTIEVYKDGKKEKSVYIKENRLYGIIEGDGYSEHLLEIVVPKAGLNVFTFTFG